jgi:hypothetical protein
MKCLERKSYTRNSLAQSKKQIKKPKSMLEQKRTTAADGNIMVRNDEQLQGCNGKFSSTELVVFMFTIITSL